MQDDEEQPEESQPTIRSELNAMTMKELRRVAKKLGLPGRSTLRKRGLVAALSEVDSVRLENARRISWLGRWLLRNTKLVRVLAAALGLLTTVVVPIVKLVSIGRQAPQSSPFAEERSSPVGPHVPRAETLETSAQRKPARIIDRVATAHHGIWKVVGDKLVGEDTAPRRGGHVARLSFGDPNWKDYDFSVKLMTTNRDAPDTDNGKGCGVRTHFRADTDWYRFSLRGGVVRTVAGKWERVSSSPRLHEHDRWFDVRVRVRGSYVEVFVDGVRITSYDAAPFSSGPVGLQCSDSIVHCKDIRVTAPDGEVLWEGLPTIN